MLLLQHYPPLSGKQKLRSCPSRDGEKRKMFAGLALEKPSLSVPPCSKTCPVLAQHVGLSMERGMLVLQEVGQDALLPFLAPSPVRALSIPKISSALSLGTGSAFSLPNRHGTWVPGLPGGWEAAAMGSGAGSTSAESCLVPALLARPES